MKKNNKGLIILIVVLGLLSVGLGGYIVYDKFINVNNIDQKESGTTETTCTPSTENGKYCIKDNLYNTDNWFSFEPLDEEIEYSVTLPDGYFLNDTIIVDKNDNKIGELSPVIKLQSGQKMLTKLSDINSTDEEVRDYISGIYDSEYYTQDNFKIFLTHNKQLLCGSREGEYYQDKFLHSFYANKDDKVFEITFYTNDKNISEELLNTFKKSSASFKEYKK